MMSLAVAKRVQLASQPTDAVQIARTEHRPHSLIESQRTWQRVAVVPGVCQAWGYAYENGMFTREASV